MGWHGQTCLAVKIVGCDDSHQLWLPVLRGEYCLLCGYSDKPGFGSLSGLGLLIPPILPAKGAFFNI